MALVLGNIACRLRQPVLMLGTDRMLKRLKAARLHQNHDQEVHKLIPVDLLIIDDFISISSIRPRPKTPTTSASSFIGARPRSSLPRTPDKAHTFSQTSARWRPNAHGSEVRPSSTESSR